MPLFAKTLLILLSTTLLLATGCSRHTEYEQLQQKAKSSLNPIELQKQVQPLLGKFQGSQDVPLQNIPPSLTNLYAGPPNHAFAEEYQGGKFLTVDWGGPDWDFGLMIGNGSLKDDDDSNIAPRVIDHWTNGVYFWRNGRRSSFRLY